MLRSVPGLFTSPRVVVPRVGRDHRCSLISRRYPGGTTDDDSLLLVASRRRGRPATAASEVGPAAAQRSRTRSSRVRQLAGQGAPRPAICHPAHSGWKADGILSERWLSSTLGRSRHDSIIFIASVSNSQWICGGWAAVSKRRPGSSSARTSRLYRRGMAIPTSHIWRGRTKESRSAATPPTDSADAERFPWHESVSCLAVRLHYVKAGRGRAWLHSETLCSPHDRLIEASESGACATSPRRAGCDRRPWSPEILMRPG